MTDVGVNNVCLPQVSYADVAVFHIFGFMERFGEFNPLNKFAKLLEHKKRMEAIPQIADWIKNRPQTDN